MGQGTAREMGERLVAHAAELASAGVTYLSAGVPGGSIDEVLDGIAWFGEHVVPQIAAI